MNTGMRYPDDLSLIDIADLALALDTDLEQGLGAEEAGIRLRADGPNELRAVPPVPAWRRALAQLQDPLVYLLGAAAAVALAAWWFEGRGHQGAAGWPLDAIVITVVVVLNAVLGWLQESKAAQAVAALAKMTIATSSVLRDGAVARVPSANLVKGDVLVLAEGDAVGADARLAQAAALKLLEAPLTHCERWPWRAARWQQTCRFRPMAWRRPRWNRSWNTLAPWASSTPRARRRPWPLPRLARPASA